MGTFLRILIVLLLVACICWGLPKLFPPTEKDRQRAEEEAARRLQRYEARQREMEAAAARREAKKRKKS